MCLPTQFRKPQKENKDHTFVVGSIQCLTKKKNAHFYPIPYLSLLAIWGFQKTILLPLRTIIIIKKKDTEKDFFASTAKQGDDLP